MDRKARFGIIGSAGLIGNYHTDVLSKGQGDYQLTALCDIDRPRLEDQCRRLNLPGTADGLELVRRDDVDAVVVAVPHPLHSKYALAAVEAGKDVLIEKPLAATPGDARAMLKAIRKSKRIAGIHYQGRTRPTIQKARAMIDAGELGHLLCIRLTGSYYKSDYYYSLGGWRGTWKGEGGGVLINQAPHDIDTMCFLAGGQAPAELLARWANQYHANSQAEDIAFACGRFANGCEFALNVSVSLHGDVSRFEVFGSGGALTITNGVFTRYVRYQQDLLDFARSYGGPNPYAGPEVEEQPLPPAEGENDPTLIHKRLAQAVLTRDKKKLVVSAFEGLWSMETIAGIFLSGYAKKAVKLPVSAWRYDKMLQDLIANAPPVERAQAAAQEGMQAKF